MRQRGQTLTIDIRSRQGREVPSAARPRDNCRMSMFDPIAASLLLAASSSYGSSIGPARSTQRADWLSGTGGVSNRKPSQETASEGGRGGDILAEPLLTDALSGRQERNPDGKRRMGMPPGATHFATPVLRPHCDLCGLRTTR